jgi:hypothetical protein
MAYLGTKPQSGFISQEANQYFTGLTQNYIDLNQSISSLSSVIVLVNGVVQENSDLTLTSTSRITLGATLVASDKVTCIYVAKISSTQAPATGSVTSDMLSGSIANSKLANSSVSINGSTLALGGSLTGIGDDNAPSFMSYMSSTQAISNNSTTVLAFNNDSGTTGGIKAYDTNNAFNTSTYRFTPQTAGYYFAFMYVGLQDLNSGNLYVINLMKNGSSDGNKFSQFQIRQNGTDNIYGNTQGITYLNGSSDYINATLYHNHGSNRSTADTYNTGFGAYRLAGVS